MILVMRKAAAAVVIAVVIHMETSRTRTLAFGKAFVEMFSLLCFKKSKLAVTGELMGTKYSWR